MQSAPKKENETFKITGNWPTQSTELKKKYSNLTDTDLALEEGKDEELVKRVETRLGKKRDEVIKILNDGRVENKN